MPILPSTISNPLSSSHNPFSLESLIDQVRDAVDQDCPEQTVRSVRATLENAVRNHAGFLPDHFLAAKPGSYARREIHTDPEGRFSILAMVWAADQGTMLHDHGGLWVVECIYSGQVKVRNYEYLGEQDDLHLLNLIDERLDGPGVSDGRVPPGDHHVLQNAAPVPSVSIHVFGGILDHCNVFLPVPGGYQRESKYMQFD